MDMEVFVYGTLRVAEQANRVLGHATYTAPAVVEGLRRVEGAYPTLAPGGTARGRLLRLGDGGLAALDRYEGVDRGLYVRVRLPVDDGGSAWTYIGDPDALGVDVEWPGDGRLESRVTRYLDREPVRIRRLAGESHVDTDDGNG